MAIEICTAKYYQCSSLRTEYNPKLKNVIVLVKIAFTKTNPIATPQSTNIAIFQGIMILVNWNNVIKLKDFMK